MRSFSIVEYHMRAFNTVKNNSAKYDLIVSSVGLRRVRQSKFAGRCVCPSQVHVLPVKNVLRLVSTNGMS